MEHESDLPPAQKPVVAVYAALGVASLAVEGVGAVGRRVRSLARPASRVLAHPPLVPSRLQPGTVLDTVARGSSALRGEIRQELVRRLDDLVPRLVSGVLDRVDVTELVLARVDLDRIVAAADLDAAVGRLDVDAVVDRVDLPRLARDVIAEVDLPEIIRESTGAVASDTLRGVRMQGISGDEAVGRSVARFRLRLAGRGPGRAAPPPPAPSGETGVPASSPSEAPGGMA